MQSDLIGRRLGPFEILEFRGYEGLVEVYHGHDTQREHPVEIKLAGRAMEADPVFNTRFRRDARAIAGLRHPNISRLLDFGQAEGGHYMVSDYVEGVTLSTLMDEVRAGERILEPEDITFVIRQVASALDHAHKNSISHLDLRPEHIVLTRSGQAIVSNFGVSLLNSAGSADRIAAPTPYMAPEQLIDARTAGPASDIYALGVILYQITTGELPFNSESDVDGIMRDLNDSAPDPRLLNESISASVSAVILKALSKSPAQRFRTAMQLATTLERAYAQPLLGEAIFETKKPGAELETGAAGRRQGGMKRDMTPEERREKRRLDAEIRRIKRAEDWERFKAWWGVFRANWGRTMVVLSILVLLMVAVLYLLQTVGVLKIAFELPPLPPPQTQVAESGTATATTSAPGGTDVPVVGGVPTERPTATALAEAGGTPVSPVTFAPLGVGTTAFRLPDGQVMAYVPAGQFLMGTNVNVRGNNSKPQHPVTLGAYWIDRTEITNAQFRVCVESDICTVPTNQTYYNDPIYSDYPVSFVTYQHSVSYCLWIAQRTGQVVGLPTEAQWEKAAGWDPISGVQRDYPWGNEPPNPDRLRYTGSGAPRPASPVGSHPLGASAYGVHDMAGNVWEWVADWFDEGYYRRTGVSLDPTGPLTGTSRITRGGSWTRDARLAITTVRNPVRPSTTSNEIGFRCAMTATRPPASSRVMLAPLDLVAEFQQNIDALRSDGSADVAVLDEWTQALESLRQALVNVDHQTALGIIAQRLERIASQRANDQLSQAMALQLDGGLRWIEVELVRPAATPVPTTAIQPTPLPTP